MGNFILFLTLIYLGSNLATEFNVRDIETTSLSPATTTQKPERKCEKQGTMCKDCSTLVQCIEDDNGFIEVFLEKCNAGSTCYLDQKCSTNFNPNCTTYTFDCTGTGIFPDPFDCKKYHICTPGQNCQAHMKCKDGHLYNMVTTYCDIKMKDCPIDFPVPQCTKVGQTGALTNKSIFYICQKKGEFLLPELHLCSEGKWYNGTMCLEHK